MQPKMHLVPIFPLILVFFCGQTAFSQSVQHQDWDGWSCSNSSDKCVKLLPEKATFEEAFKLCAGHKGEGDLLTPTPLQIVTADDEATAILEVMPTEVMSERGILGFWLNSNSLPKLKLPEPVSNASVEVKHAIVKTRAGSNLKKCTELIVSLSIDGIPSTYKVPKPCGDQSHVICQTRKWKLTSLLEKVVETSKHFATLQNHTDVLNRNKFELSDKISVSSQNVDKLSTTFASHSISTKLELQRLETKVEAEITKLAKKFDDQDASFKALQTKSSRDQTKITELETRVKDLQTEVIKLKAAKVIQENALTVYGTRTKKLEDSHCGVEPKDRVECGWGGIKEWQCKRRGCCYDTEKNTKWCFKKVSNRAHFV